MNAILWKDYYDHLNGRVVNLIGGWTDIGLLIRGSWIPNYCHRCWLVVIDSSIIVLILVAMALVQTMFLIFCCNVMFKPKIVWNQQDNDSCCLFRRRRLQSSPEKSWYSFLGIIKAARLAVYMARNTTANSAQILDINLGGREGSIIDYLWTCEGSIIDFLWT